MRRGRSSSGSILVTRIASSTMLTARRPQRIQALWRRAEPSGVCAIPVDYGVVDRASRRRPDRVGGEPERRVTMRATACGSSPTTAWSGRRGAGRPPLLMVHGFTGAKEDFADHVDRASPSTPGSSRFDHRGHGESDDPPTTPPPTRSTASPPTRSPSPTRSGSDRFTLLGHSMGGMVARRLVLAHPERVDALVLMDTSPGPPRGHRPRARAAARPTSRSPTGMTVLRGMLDEANALGSEADERVRAEPPGLRGVQRPQVGRGRAGRVRRPARVRSSRQPDQLAAHAVDHGARRSCIVGEQDEPFLDAVAPHGRHDPRRRARRDPRRRPLTPVREPGGLVRRVDGFVRRAAPRPGLPTA